MGCSLDIPNNGRGRNVELGITQLFTSFSYLGRSSITIREGRVLDVGVFVKRNNGAGEFRVGN
jgi:hypothetical protein